MPQPRRARSSLEGEIIVVADPAAGLEATGASVASAAVDAAPIGKALKQAKAGLQPLFGATEARVRYGLSAAASITDAPLPDLSVYYRVAAPDGADLDTSSASPIVVGVLGCIQGVRRARGSAPLTAAQARQTLRATGSPQQDAPGRPTAQRIGNRPNLRVILERRVKPIRKEAIKETKEFKLEKREIKEGKGEFKEQKREKLEWEVDKRVGEFDVKGVREIDPRRIDFQIDPLRYQQQFGGGPGCYEEAREHFIDRELRPDLSTGALQHEDDLGFLDS